MVGIPGIAFAPAANGAVFALVEAGTDDFVAVAQVDNKALGAFAGFICGTGLKLIASGMMMYYIFVYIR